MGHLRHCAPARGSGQVRAVSLNMAMLNSLISERYREWAPGMEPTMRGHIAVLTLVGAFRHIGKRRDKASNEAREIIRRAAHDVAVAAMYQERERMQRF